VNLTNWRRRFVAAVYATHNSSPQIRRALERCRSEVKAGDRILNVGCGDGQRAAQTTNLDYADAPTVDCRGDAECLPFKASVFKLVITQETLEHVRRPAAALDEIARVLAPGGTLYLQLPFVIGYHPGPSDFWRFTREGITEMLERAGFVCDDVGIAVGPATGFYRIAVEFWAVIASRLGASFYIPAKGVFALALAPLKLLDGVLLRAPQADRIAGGYYVIARKCQ
jgi:SAM-dependent methyltransferase